MSTYLVKDSLGRTELVGSGSLVRHHHGHRKAPGAPVKILAFHKPTGAVIGYDSHGHLVGCDRHGNVVGGNEIGSLWSKIKSAGKAIGKTVYKDTGAKAVVQAAKDIKHPMRVLRDLATAAISPALAATRLASSLPGIKQLLALVGSTALTPLKLYLKPKIRQSAIDLYAKKAGRTTPNANDMAAASRGWVKAMKASNKPLVKAGGYLLEKFGTGIKGGTGSVGLIVSGNTLGHDEVGMTGLEIAAIVGAIVAATAASIPLLAGAVKANADAAAAQNAADGN
jgi:hypothetical protein